MANDAARHISPEGLATLDAELRNAILHYRPEHVAADEPHRSRALARGSRSIKPDRTGTAKSAQLSPAVRVYVGSTQLSFEVFGRHRRGADSSERYGFARPETSSGDT